MDPEEYRAESRERWTSVATGWNAHRERMSNDKTPSRIKLDERNHVEKPLLDQPSSLAWAVIDLDSKPHASTED